MESDKKTMKSIMKIAAFVVVLAFLLNHIGNLFAVIGAVLGLLSPLIIGGAIAFIMNVPMSSFEKYCFKKIKNQSLKRILSVVCAFPAVLLVMKAICRNLLMNWILAVQAVSSQQ